MWTAMVLLHQQHHAWLWWPLLLLQLLVLVLLQRLLEQLDVSQPKQVMRARALNGLLRLARRLLKLVQQECYLRWARLQAPAHASQKRCCLSHAARAGDHVRPMALAPRCSKRPDQIHRLHVQTAAVPLPAGFAAARCGASRASTWCATGTASQGQTGR